MAPKTRQPNYQELEVRVASFNASNKGNLGASQAKRGAKSKTWPHALTETFNPESLAKAGFYFNPSDEASDNCTCFLCGKGLGGWEKGDIPYKEHVTHDENGCAWANAVCQVKFQDRINNHTFMFTTSERLPRSEAMEVARHETFSEWWPHDNVARHKASSEKMAHAGFHYTPDARAVDLVTCVYCNVELDGWQPKDDPMAEHQRKSPTCVLFTAGDRTGVKISLRDPPEDDVPAPSTGAAKKIAKSSSSQAPSSQLPKSKPSRNLRNAATDSELDAAPSKRATRIMNMATTSNPDATDEGEASASEAEVAKVEPAQPPALKTKGKTTKATISQQTSTSAAEVGPAEVEPVKKKRGRPPKKQPAAKPGPDVQTEATQIQTQVVEPSIVEPLQPKKRGRPKSKKPNPEPELELEPDLNPTREVVELVTSDDDAPTTKPTSRELRNNDKAVAAEPIAAISVSPTRVTRSQSKQPAHSDLEDVTDGELKPQRLTRAASVSQTDDAPDFRRSTRVRGKVAMTSESEADNPIVTFTRSTRSKPAHPPTLVNDAAISDFTVGGLSTVDADSAQTAKPKKKGKGKVASTRRPGTEARKKPTPREDVQMEDAPDDVALDLSEQSSKGENTPTTTIHDESDESSDAEEVETTILVQTPIVSGSATPITPPRPAPASAQPVAPQSLAIPAIQPMFPLPPISNFTEAELSMTLEEWVRHETRRQYEVLRADGERRIADFIDKARGIRKKIEAL
ncbi:BIR-domain-containing protein [Dacryopinax primogenitus]|uniref:BIR-domain-containing protein n=1 Tax=Dacryopinax primogenitus (strain DJM 731) TaxID=1858805 RepID=M5FQS5_DACPD|nr:BIR-domain-containing protein [Dacryopinax primogenitus]EJT99305.1 BIR-domain-containing protein [Dacryopinax primogenitus]